MPDNVIVTLIYQKNKLDMELPAKLPISMWKELLMKALQQSFFSADFEKKECRLSYGGVTLAEDKTLEEYGIYDGSYLVIM